jgi:hypothetical protein
MGLRGKLGAFGQISSFFIQLSFLFLLASINDEEDFHSAVSLAHFRQLVSPV